MLECDALHIGPWLDSESGSVRRISDMKSGAQQGVVRRLALGRWWPWPHQGVLQVLETEDEALVFSVHGPSWLGSWHFHDAEERYLGSLLRGSRVVNGASEKVAWLHPAGTKVLFVDSAGKEIGSFETLPAPGQFSDKPGDRVDAFLPRPGGEWLLRFSRNLGTNPFTRMLFLGVLIAQAERPSQ